MNTNIKTFACKNKEVKQRSLLKSNVLFLVSALKVIHTTKKNISKSKY
jgi:hypothetical protein